MRTLYFYRLSHGDQNTVKRWHFTFMGFYSAVLLLLLAVIIVRAPGPGVDTLATVNAVPNLETLSVMDDGAGNSATAARSADLQR